MIPERVSKLHLLLGLLTLKSITLGIAFLLVYLGSLNAGLAVFITQFTVSVFVYGLLIFKPDDWQLRIRK